MTNKIKFLPILVIITLVLLSSCGAGTTDRLTIADTEAFEDYILSSYFMQRGDDIIPESRAAWDYTKPVTLPAEGETSSSVTKNYPESGQTTTVTISKEASMPANVYKVENITTYPSRDALHHTTESYYILDYPDGSPDGIYTSDDPICESDGDVNPLSRESFVTVYDNGLERSEKIVATKSSSAGPEGAVNYADFDINDTLRFPDPDDSTTHGGGNFNVEGTEWSPGANPAAVWSSMVSYDQEVNYNYNKWTYTYHIIGIRYYTENSDDLRTSVTYQRGIATSSASESFSNHSNWRARLYSIRNSKKEDASKTTYIETVIRTQLTGSENKKVKMKSYTYGEDSASIVTFTADYEEDKGEIVKPGRPVAAYF